MSFHREFADSSVLAALARPIYASRGETGVGASMMLESPGERYDETVYIDALSQALGFRNFKAPLSASWCAIGRRWLPVGLQPRAE